MEITQLDQGLHTWQSVQGFRIVQLHYTADPAKRAADWLVAAKLGIPTQDWEIEYELSFVSRAGKPVFADFNHNVHVKAVEPIPAPVWVGWDFGYHHPAVAALQVSEAGQIRVALSILGSDVELDRFARDIVLPQLKAKFPAHEDFRHCCDVAGRQAKDSGSSSEVVLQRVVGETFSRWSEVEVGLGLIRRKMAMRVRDEALFILDPSCTLLIDGARGGWVYPTQSSGSDVAPEPDDKSIYKNVWDAVRYAALFAAPDESTKRFSNLQIPIPGYLVSRGSKQWPSQPGKRF